MGRHGPPDRSLGVRGLMPMAADTVADLAVIGGGQSCKAVLMKIGEGVARRRHASLPRRIVVIERGDTFGAGQAWGPDTTLAGHCSSQPSGYPRAVYGREQAGVFGNLTRWLCSQGIDVRECARTDVTAMDREGDAWVLRAQGAEPIRARRVVLATGHWVDEPMYTTPVVDCPAWATRPAMASLDHVDAKTLRIGVVGSYLAAVDLALAAAWRLGEFMPRDGRLVYRPQRPFLVEMISRGGRLPGVWPRRVAAYPLRHFTPGRLREGLSSQRGGQFIPLTWMAGRLCDELGLRIGSDDEALASLEALYERVGHRGALAAHGLATARSRMSDEAADGAHWQRVMNASLPVFSEHFAQLSAEDHLLFQRRHRSAYFGMAMPMALRTAEQLDALARAGCLAVTAATPLSLTAGNDGTVEARLQSSSSILERTFHRVFNGRNPGTWIERHPHALVRGLLQNGLLRPATKAFASGEGHLPVEGAHVDTATCAAHATGRSGDPRLYVMGPPLLGLFADAQSLGHLARDAERIINDGGSTWG